MKKEYIRLLFLENNAPILIYNAQYPKGNIRSDMALFFSHTYHKDFPKRIYEKNIEVYRNSLYFDKEEVYNSNLFIRLK